MADVFAAAIASGVRRRARNTWQPILALRALLEPLGTMPFDEAYELFAEQVRAADAAGADLFIIETMADLLEMKAAILLRRKTPIAHFFATMTFGEDGPRSWVRVLKSQPSMLSSLGVDVWA